MEAVLSFIAQHVFTEAGAIILLLGLLWFMERKERVRTVEKLNTAFGSMGELLRVMGDVSRRQEDMRKQLDDLWEWHAKTDEDGVRVWYVRKSLERNVESLTHNIASQTELMKRMLEKEEEQIRSLSHLRRKCCESEES